MGLPSGLSSQIGYTVESTYGTWVTPATFQPLVSETLNGDDARSESEGAIAGLSVLGSGQWVPSARTVGGDVGLELFDRGIGKLFKMMFGGVATTGSGPYTHTFTPSTLPSYSWQVGRPQNDGTVIPCNYTGMKVASWELAAKADEIATLGLTLMGQNETIGSRVVTDGVTTNSSTAITSATAAFTQADVGKLISGTGITSGTTIAAVTSGTAATLSAAATATGTSISFTIGAALASASYASGQVPVHFKNGSLTLAGSTCYFSECTIKGENELSDRRPTAGSVLTREHLPADRRVYTVDIKAEFDDLTTQIAYRAGTEAALVLAFTVGTYTLTVSGNIRYDQSKVNAASKGILERDITGMFTRSSSTDASAITAVLVNGDSAP